MDRSSIKERLRALASDDKKRSKAARLRDVIDDVEGALSAGVPRAVVVEELAAHGLNFSLASFVTTLQRIREKRAKPSTTPVRSIGQVIGESAKPTAAPQVVESEPEAESSASGSHNPADIDRIIGDKPDLAALSKSFKEKRKKK